ncbi:hypothetical protein AB0I28_38600 [Phytomonospora sp. NPDC050363]|uniref:hypothetical protein n=1 Tax=Phytomonospora sp. NPDC050363 TaxID=3155642 RepID=UPI0033F2909F
MAEQWFEGNGLDELAAIIDADYAQVPIWRSQAAAYRKLTELAELHHSKITGHLQRAMDHWSSRATSVVRYESSGIAESFQRGMLTASGNARALDAIADAIEAAKTDLDEIRAEWAAMKAAYEKDPHVFDNYAIDGVTGFQAAKASYDQAARDRMHTMSVETTQAWHTDMHEPGPYTGPTYGNVPRVPVTPSDGSGSGGGRDITYPFTYTPPPPTPPPPAAAGADPPLLTPTPRPPDGPQLEFPTPGPGPGVITGPGPVPTPSPVGPAPLSPMHGTPPPNPGLFGGMRPSATPGLPVQRPGGMSPAPAGGPRTSPSVLGQRPTQAGLTRPAAASAANDRGVIRNPRQAATNNAGGGQRGRAQDEDRYSPAHRDGPETDELFEGLALDAGPDVVRPEPPTKVRRRDAGPALRRVPRKS